MDKISSAMRLLGRGGIFLAEYFLMLVYPAGDEKWSFLDKLYPKRHSNCLRFVFRTKIGPLPESLIPETSSPQQTLQPPFPPPQRFNAQPIPADRVPSNVPTSGDQPEDTQLPIAHFSPPDVSEALQIRNDVIVDIDNHTRNLKPLECNMDIIQCMPSPVPEKAKVIFNEHFRVKFDDLARSFSGQPIQGEPIKFFLHFPTEKKDELRKLKWLFKELPIRTYDSQSDEDSMIIKSGVILV